MSESRYTVELDMYVWAANDADAIEKVKEFAKKLNDKHESQARVMNLYSTPFATLGARKVEVTA